MMPALKIVKTCAVCGATYTAAEFDLLELCSSRSCPDGVLRIEGCNLVLRQCADCPNTLACRL